jgi:hypothetical protein
LSQPFKEIQFPQKIIALFFSYYYFEYKSLIFSIRWNLNMNCCSSHLRRQRKTLITIKTFNVLKLRMKGGWKRNFRFQSSSKRGN